MAQSTQLLASDTIDLREPVAGSSRFVTTTPEPGAQMAEHHHMSRWVQPALMILAVWLATSPPIFGYESLALTISDLVSAAALVVLALPAFAAPTWPGCRRRTGAVLLPCPPQVFMASTSAALAGTNVFG